MVDSVAEEEDAVDSGEVAAVEVVEWVVVVTDPTALLVSMVLVDGCFLFAETFSCLVGSDVPFIMTSLCR